MPRTACCCSLCPEQSVQGVLGRGRRSLSLSPQERMDRWSLSGPALLCYLEVHFSNDKYWVGPRASPMALRAHTSQASPAYLLGKLPVGDLPGQHTPRVLCLLLGF